MRILSSTEVFLGAGEVIPAFCPCGEIYQPEQGSEMSDCPSCGRPNIHGMFNVARVGEEE